MRATKRRKNKAGRITAWLVTWEWTGEHARRKDKIAALLSPKLAPKRIAELIEMIYANEFCTYRERLAFVKDNELNPNKATFDDIDGLPWQWRIFCGHNPYLEARLVDNLYVTHDSEGNQHLLWEERKNPDMSWIKRKPTEDCQS